jgi:hypothetical protein
VSETETPVNRLPSEPDDFPAKPTTGYPFKVEYPADRILTWEAILAFHGEKNGNVKQDDRKLAVGTRNAIVHGCDVDRVNGVVGFARGWMHFQSAEQINHILKCFDWQLGEKGPGIPLEKMVLADPIIDGLTILAAKAEADLATAKAKLEAAAAVEAAKAT